MNKSKKQAGGAEEAKALRHYAVMSRARKEGLVGEGKDARISGRVSRQLIEAAKHRSAITSDTELIEYALARIAAEDDFVERIYRREGKVPKSVDLEF